MSGFLERVRVCRRKCGFIPLLLHLALLVPVAGWSGSDHTSWAPVLHIRADAVGTLYVVTAEQGGLYASANGGRTWRHLGVGFTPSPISSLSLGPGGQLLLATFREVLTSSDGGATWSSLGGRGEFQHYGATAAGTLVAVHWEQGLMWASRESPRFQKAAGEAGEYLVTAIAESGDGRLWSGTLGGGVLFSDDGGRSWSAISPGPANPSVLDLAWHESAEALYAGTLEGGVFRQDETGGWRPINDGLPAGATVQALAVAANGALWAGTHGSGCFVLRSGETRWHPISGTGGGAGLSVTALHPYRDGMVVGTLAHGLVFAQDRPSLWQPLLPADPVVGLAAGDHRSVLALTRSGSILTSGDGGRSWRVRASVGAPAPCTTLVRTPDGIWLAGSVGAVYRSRDGSMWDRFPLPFEEPVETMAAATGGVFAGTRGQGLFRSPDGRSAWAPVADVDGSFIQAIEASPEGIVAVGTDRGFAVSTDGGVTWANRFVAYGISSVHIDGEGGVWGTSRNGLWRVCPRDMSSEAVKIDGFRWSPFAALGNLFSGEEGVVFAVVRGGLVRLVPVAGDPGHRLERTPLNNVQVLASLPVPGGGMVLATPRGFLRSGDGGASWEEVELP